MPSSRVRLSQQDTEEYPAGAALLQGLGEEQGGYNTSDDENFDGNEEEEPAIGQNGGRRLGYNWVASFPRNSPCVRIDRNSCGVHMMVTMADGTKKLCFCTKRIGSCQLHSNSEQGRFQEVGYVLAANALRSNKFFPPGLIEQGVCKEPTNHVVNNQADSD